jgi:hypothetical protein
MMNITALGNSDLHVSRLGASTPANCQSNRTPVSIAPHFPAGFRVVAEQTIADEAGFVLTLRTTTAKATPGSALLIAGGDPARTTVEANKRGGTGALIEALTIRGQAGTIASSGFGATLAWIEDGVPYSVSGGNLNREQIIAFAEALETVDLSR